MQRLRLRFGGLYWRLTIAYFLVTLIAALIIATALTIQPTINDLSQSRDMRQFAATLQQQDTAQLTPYVEHTAPDPQTLQATIIPDLSHALTAEPKLGPILYIAVVDQQGSILAASNQCTPAPNMKDRVCGDLISPQLTEALATPRSLSSVRNALDNDPSPASWIAGVAHATLIAVPIRASDNATSVGALLVAVYGEPGTGADSVWSFIGAFLNRLQPYGLYFLFLAATIGTLTGLFITRNVTRRLRHITQAADSWSQGDFTVAVRDPVRDEIGQLAQDLNDMATQIQTLLTTREALAVVEERNRLARDLHDSVKQHIFANALLVNAARNLLEHHPEQVSAHLEAAEQLAQLAQDELTTLIRALRPAALADKGLAAVLRDYADEWSARMGIAVALHIAGERVTPLPIEAILLRVAQEALTNVARHSGATQVSIALTWQAEALTMTIADDGHGFHTHHPHPGIGLKSMEERLAAAQGTLTITSATTGTTIQATLPLTLAEQTVEAHQ